MRSNIITLEFIKEWFVYDPETGIFTSKIYKRPVGTVDPLGYVRIHIGEKGVLAHRLAWLYMTGDLLDKKVKIDHIDRNPSNNKWDNLRIATQTQNTHNRGPVTKVSTTSKYKGVFFASNKGLVKAWKANITNNGISVPLGCFYSEGGAALAYNEAATKLHGEFAYLNDVDPNDVREFDPKGVHEGTGKKIRKIYWNGQKEFLKDIVAQCGNKVSVPTVGGRLADGWDLESAVTVPSGKYVIGSDWKNRYRNDKKKERDFETIK